MMNPQAHLPASPARALRSRGILALSPTLLVLLLAAPQPAWAQDAPSDPCRSKTVQSAVASVQRNAMAIVQASLQPGATPAAWVGEFEELMADQTMILGLCEDAKVLDRGCPFCNETNLPLTVETAPVHLLRWMLKRPTLLDPRYRPAPAEMEAPVRHYQTLRRQRSRRAR